MFFKYNFFLYLNFFFLNVLINFHCVTWTLVVRVSKIVLVPPAAIWLYAAAIAAAAAAD